MKGVKFNDFHSFTDFSLILSSKEIEAPTPKTEIVNVPGGDGVLDLSEAFGEIKFNNRKITFLFSTIVPKSEFLSLFSTIQNAIHGQRMRIVIDDDPEFYYIGRITVDSWKADRNVGTITVECDCDPYKYRKYKTVLQTTVTDSAYVIYDNLRKRVIPTITLTEAAQITFNGATYSFDAGTHTTAEIVFTAGKNAMTITGATTIIVEYQEGGL